MDIETELKNTVAKQKEAIEKLNQLRQQFQQDEQNLLQEILRLDGEVRLLQRLGSNGDKAS